MKIYEIDENFDWKILDFLFSEKRKTVSVKRGKYSTTYEKAYCGFDIETTQINLEDDRKRLGEKVDTSLETHFSFMYHWQFTYFTDNNECVFLGRTWNDFLHFFEVLKKGHKKNIIVWVANLGYEFQFIRKRINVDRIFAKKEREPLIVESDNIEFREALAISGGSLENLAKAYTKTQKLKGDLDYDILRNSKTPLTEKEKQYCINDVIILSEFSQFIFSEFIEKKHYLPLTKTAILRHKVKESLTQEEKEKVYYSFPYKRLYDLSMEWCFRGAFTHANILHSDEILEDIDSIDFTSSYPSAMFRCYFPQHKFIHKKHVSRETFLELCATKCVMATVRFENIEATTPHSIESISKIYDYPKNGTIVDNGRLRKAEYIEVMITELDFEIYEMFYKWDTFEVFDIWYTDRGDIQYSILKNMCDDYITKWTLKKNGKSKTREYMLSKNAVNSYYGMTVTRIVKNEIIYDDESKKWCTEKRTIEWKKEKQKAIMSPFTGIWVTAHARKKLLEMVKKIGNEVVYCDTDSIKMLNFEKYKKMIFEYNKKVEKENKKLCKKYDLDFEIFKDLGCFDWETKGDNYVKFKTLGSKRYIYETQSGHFESTISGLPKGTLEKYCTEKGIDKFEFFSNEMFLPFSGKKMSCYNDEKTYYNVDGELMQEESSICLFEATFNLTLDKIYIKMLKNYKDWSDR